MYGDEPNTLCYVFGTYSGNSWSLTEEQIIAIKEAYKNLQGKITYKLAVTHSRMWDDYSLQVAYSGSLADFLSAVKGCKNYLHYDMLFNTTLDNSVLIIEE